MPSPISYHAPKMTFSRSWSIATTLLSPPCFRWHLLPDDVQQRVFYFAASTDEGNPPGAKINLCLVSKAWRDLCIHTPDLWTNVTLSLDDPVLWRLQDPLRRDTPTDLEFILENRTQNARRWLERAGALKTTVHILLLLPDRELFRDGRYDELLAQMFDGSVAQHLGVLLLSVHPCMFSTIFGVLGTTQGDFPALRQISVLTADVQDANTFPPDDVVGDSNAFPSLAGVGVTDGSNSMGNFLLHASTYLPLRQLKSVTIRSEYLPMNYWDNFSTVLRQCEHLETLTLFIPGWEPPSENDSITLPPITLPNLKLLSLELCSPRSTVIQAIPTNLGSTDLSPIMRSFTLPSLSVLRISNETQGRSLSCLGRSLLECHRRSNFSLIHFTAYGVRWDTPLFLAFLETCHELQVLSIVQCNLDFGKLFRPLTVKRVSDSESTKRIHLLPRLEHFQLVAYLECGSPNLNPITMEEVVELLVSRWDRSNPSNGIYGDRLDVRRCKTANIMLPLDLCIKPLDQRALKTLERLRGEGMDITVTLGDQNLAITGA